MRRKLVRKNKSGGRMKCKFVNVVRMLVTMNPFWDGFHTESSIVTEGGEEGGGLEEELNSYVPRAKVTASLHDVSPRISRERELTPLETTRWMA
jgi:hypothetical protein